MSRIYLSAPHLGTLEETFAREAFATNWVSTVGPNLEAFEKSFSELVGGLPCVALSSGTAAIHLGLKLLGIEKNDEVVCPTLTFAASANPIVYEGARPIFVDSERRSWNLDPERLAEAIEDRIKRGRKPKAVIVVHLYGQSADLEGLESVCAKYEIPILEDAAEALGTTYRDVQVGTRAPVSIFSFNGNKIITTSGGGMLVARDPAWVAKARFWSQQSREPSIAYEHKELGYNYRMSNVLAGIGRGQLAVLHERVAARRAVAERYEAAFRDLPGMSLMPQAPWGLHTNWLSVFLVDSEATRNATMEALAAQNIEARPVWKPMHLQPVFADCPRYGGEVAEDLFTRGICLPSSSSLSVEDQQRVIDVVSRVVASRSEPRSSAAPRHATTMGEAWTSRGT